MTTATIETFAPGIYDIPAEVYHADQTSLSSTGARKMLPPSCPAKFRYEQDNPSPPSDEFSFGHAAHRLILHAGADLVEIDARDYKTNKAKEAKAAALAENKTPILPHQKKVAEAMAAVVLNDPIAGALFEPGTGVAEQSLFWTDATTGVIRRARPDWLPHLAAASGRYIVPDYKTCVSSAPEKFRKAMYEHGYHQQAAWYLDAVRALGIARDPLFLFVAQEKTPPYLVTTFEPDALALEIGRHLNAGALHLYAQCVAEERWPGYANDVELLALPGWVERAYLEETR